MKLQNLSTRTFVRLIVEGASLTTILLLFLLYVFTKDIRVILGGFSVMILLFFWGVIFLHYFQKKLSVFTDGLCRTLDEMMDSTVRPQINYEAETLLARISHRLERLYHVMQETRHKVEEEKAELQSLVSDISHQTKTPIAKDDVSYGDTEWKASYILDDKEAGELESKYEDEGEVIDIKSSFIDGMSVINILQAAAGNDYQYIYIDSDGAVQLKVTESQKNTLIENMNQYLSSVSEQFKNLGDGYDIRWNTDFSEISYKFDSALSKQDQSNYFTYTETIGMLNQLLKGDGNSYYIDLSIYNSSSGELVSKGNTKDGITWNIGE